MCVYSVLIFFIIYILAGLSDYALGHRFYAFDLLESCVEHCTSSTLLSGYLGLSIEFEEGVDSAHCLVVFADSPSSFDIDDTGLVRFSKAIV